MSYPFSQTQDSLESADYNLTKAWNVLTETLGDDADVELSAVVNAIEVAQTEVGNALNCGKLKRLAELDRAAEEEDSGHL